MNTDKLRGLPVITLIQPWASWVAMGWKTGETRTSFRLLNSLQGKYFLVHAGKAWDPHAIDAASPWMTKLQASRTSAFYGTTGILALVLAGKATCMTPEHEARALIKYTYEVPGGVRDGYYEAAHYRQRWFLPLERVEPLDKPIPARGQQGIWYMR